MPRTALDGWCLPSDVAGPSASNCVHQSTIWGPGECDDSEELCRFTCWNELLTDCEFRGYGEKSLSWPMGFRSSGPELKTISISRIMLRSGLRGVRWPIPMSRSTQDLDPRSIHGHE